MLLWEFSPASKPSFKTQERVKLGRRSGRPRPKLLGARSRLDRRRFAKPRPFDARTRRDLQDAALGFFRKIFAKIPKVQNCPPVRSRKMPQIPTSTWPPLGGLLPASPNVLRPPSRLGAPQYGRPKSSSRKTAMGENTERLGTFFFNFPVFLPTFKKNNIFNLIFINMNSFFCAFLETFFRRVCRNVFFFLTR